MRRERLSSRVVLEVECPRCHEVWSRVFQYGCYDKFVNGGRPRYFCEACAKIVENINYNEHTIFIGRSHGV